jgi:hypothetical protein
VHALICRVVGHAGCAEAKVDKLKRARADEQAQAQACMRESSS